MKTPRATDNKVVDKTESSVVTLDMEEDILPPRQALLNLRRHLNGVVESIDKILRHSKKN